MSEAGTHVSTVPPQCFNLAASEMCITLDNSQHITVNTLNIEALNNIQLQANTYIERMRLEAAQALGSAGAVFNAMNTAHEGERQNWIAVCQRMIAECQQQVAAVNSSGNVQLPRLRHEMAAEANAQLAACRQTLEVQAGSHTVE